MLQQTDTEHVYITIEIFNRNTSTLACWGESISPNQITAVCMSHYALYMIGRIFSNTFLKTDNNQFYIGPH